MKKLLFATLLLCGCLLLLFGCSSDGPKLIGEDALPFGEVYRSDLSGVKFGQQRDSSTGALSTGRTASASPNLPDEIENRESRGAFLLYERQGGNTLYVYNVNTDKTVFEVPLADIEDRADVTVTENYFVVVTKAAVAEGKPSTKVYDKNGVLFATVEGRQTPVVSSEGLLLEDKFYRMKDGTVQKEYTVPPFFKVANVDFFTDDYAVILSDTGVSFFDQGFNLVSFFEIPGTTLESECFLLDSGKVLLQYTTEVDPTSDAYDVLIASIKCNVTHLLLDPTTGKDKELDLDILIESIYNEHTPLPNDPLFFELEDVYTEKVKNILFYYAVDGGLLDSKTAHYVIVDGEGEIGAQLDTYVEGQKGLILPLSTSLYYAQTETGYAILDTAGNVTKTTLTLPAATEYGFYANGKIYDSEMKLVKNLSSSYSVLQTTPYSVLFIDRKNQSKYLLYTKNGEKELTGPIADRVYLETTFPYIEIMYYDFDTYSVSRTNIYSVTGELWLSEVKYVTVLASSEDATLIEYTDAQDNKHLIRLY